MTKKVNTDPKLINEVLSRGVERVYPDKTELEKAMRSGQRLRLYNGIDPSGPCLHLGHAVVLRKLRQFQELGHEVIMLIGDFTGMIGDPTDKSATRRQLAKQEVLNNCQDYKKQASHILDFSDKDNPVLIKYNSTWNSKLDFADVLDLASDFTVQQLLERDMFERRVTDGKPIHLHEFLYPLIQGYDSVAMAVDLEVGGNDQTFNMLAGRDMVKRHLGKEKFVLAMKLLEDPTGKKMGKTEGNMITLVDKPEEMYGKVMSWTDGMIVPGFEILTNVPMTEINQMDAAMKKGNPRDYKMRLAKEIVTGLLGTPAAQKAEQEFIKVFQKKDKPDQMSEIKIREKKLNVVDLFVQTKLVSSKSEARRLVDQGGLLVNDQVVKDINTEIEVKKGMILQRGKRQFVRVII
ncbi:MAG: tyrosine--tRNA ligase [Patescibacteria group bacterium]